MTDIQLLRINYLFSFSITLFFNYAFYIIINYCAVRKHFSFTFTAASCITLNTISTTYLLEKTNGRHATKGLPGKNEWLPRDKGAAWKKIYEYQQPNQTWDFQLLIDRVMQ